MSAFCGRIPSPVTRSCLISSGLTSVKVVTMGGKCEDNCLWFPLLRCVRLQFGTLSACYFISCRLTWKPVVLTGEYMMRDVMFWGEFDTGDNPITAAPTEMTLLHQDFYTGAGYHFKELLSTSVPKQSFFTHTLSNVNLFPQTPFSFNKISQSSYLQNSNLPQAAIAEHGQAFSENGLYDGHISTDTRSCVEFWYSEQYISDSERDVHVPGLLL